MSHVSFESAASLPLGRLATLFSRSFEGYFFPFELSQEKLAERVRIEHLDLHASSILVVDGEPSGVALLGVRGDRAWCGGFGLLPRFRGKGLALALTRHMLAVAGTSGATRCTLEVLCQNERAIRVYASAGFRPVRDLVTLEWARPDARDALGTTVAPAIALANVDARELLRGFDELVPACWQRDLPTLLGVGGLQGVALDDESDRRAWAIFRLDPPGTKANPPAARIAALGMRDVGAGERLLAELKNRFAKLLVVNEPAESQSTHALSAAGFVEVHRQHEMAIDLAPRKAPP